MKNLDLFKSENLLQLVMDNIPTFIFWKDRDSVYLGCNKNFANSAGLKDPGEIVGKTDFDMPWSPEESEFFRAVDKRVMDSGKEELNFEEPQTISDGSTRWLRTSKVPLFDDNNNVIGILGTYEDITIKKELELKLIHQAEILKKSNEHLKELNYNLEQANIDLEQFAYATSHDLQEPLRTIGNFVGLIERRYSIVLDENGKGYFRFIKEGVERMSNLIRGVLSYSRLKKEEEEFTKVNLTCVLNEKLKDLEKVIEDSNATITVNLPDEAVACQPLRLGILLYNLILNGIKFNQSEEPRIAVDFKELTEKWLFLIQDNGIGVEADYKDRIFQPFKRLHPQDIFPGSGIGLSICKRIVTIHGGEIWCDRNDMGGTTFFFTISKTIAAQN